MDRDEARSAVTGARGARLGTPTKTGRNDLGPITFALDDHRLLPAIDHKPKTTTQLKRLENIRANPEVSVLVDEYDDGDWSALWWVRLRGLAEVIDEGPRREQAVAALTAKYPQYREVTPAGPVIAIELV